MKTVPATNELVVLYTKSLRVYNTEILSKPHPLCVFYYEWNEVPASRGDLLPSPEGSYVMVWRWRGNSKGINSGR